MIDMALYLILLMRENPLRGQVGGGWALEIETFLDKATAILGPKTSRFPGTNPLLLALVIDLPASKVLNTELYQPVVHR